MDPQTPVPPVSPVLSKKNNLVVILLSILLLITLLISGYLFFQVQKLTKQLAQLQVQPTPTPLSTEIPSPTPNPTANWKTYTNTIYKYSLRYPQNWNVSAIANSDPTTAQEPVFNSLCDYNSGDLCQQFFVNVTKVTNSSDLEPNIVITSNDTQTDKQDLKVDGQNAKSFVLYQPNYGTNGGLSYFVITNFNGYKYTIFYRESLKNKDFKTSSDWQNKQEFDQILSTFKFTN